MWWCCLMHQEKPKHNLSVSPAQLWLVKCLQMELDEVWCALREFLLHSVPSKLSLGLLCAVRHQGGAQLCGAKWTWVWTPRFPPWGCPSRCQPQLFMPRPFSTLQGLHSEEWQLLAHQYPEATLPWGFVGGKGLLREEDGAAWWGEESQLSDHPTVGGRLVYQHNLPGTTPFHFRLSQPSRHQWMCSCKQTPWVVLFLLLLLLLLNVFLSFQTKTALPSESKAT